MWGQEEEEEERDGRTRKTRGTKVLKKRKRERESGGREGRRPEGKASPSLLLCSPFPPSFLSLSSQASHAFSFFPFSPLRKMMTLTRCTAATVHKKASLSLFLPQVAAWGKREEGRRPSARQQIHLGRNDRARSTVTQCRFSPFPLPGHYMCCAEKGCFPLNFPPPAASVQVNLCFLILPVFCSAPLIPHSLPS